jgi:hypothetical protein
MLHRVDWPLMTQVALMAVVPDVTLAMQSFTGVVEVVQQAAGFLMNMAGLEINQVGGSARPEHPPPSPHGCM